MGLVAREIEGRGIPTCSLTSALSITQAVRPPRAVHVDFPLGHTAGKPGEPDLQYAIVSDALKAFETLESPGQVVRLPYAWGEDDVWKETSPPAEPGGRPRDDRGDRTSDPYYQNEADREAAERALATGGCSGCVWTE